MTTVLRIRIVLCGVLVDSLCTVALKCLEILELIETVLPVWTADSGEACN
jgi:hypothetical protein